MRVAVEKLDGVESVVVSLEDGVATVVFAGHRDTSLARVRQVVRDNGFSPKATDLRVIGRPVVGDDGHLSMVIGGQHYQLLPDAETPQVLDELRSVSPQGDVAIEGWVPEDGETDQPASEFRVRGLERVAEGATGARYPGPGSSATGQ